MPDFYTHSSGLTASREQILARHRLIVSRYLADRELADYREPLPVTVNLVERHDA